MLALINLLLKDTILLVKGLHIKQLFLPIVGLCVSLLIVLPSGYF